MSKSPQPASLESLIDWADSGLEVLHPGGLELTLELAQLCQIDRTSRVLDVCSGTGECACFLAEKFGCRVLGVDASPNMIQRAVEKAGKRFLPAEFKLGDAHQLPFEAGSFDAALCECTLCLLDKQKALSEMVRVVRPGGWVGMHDLFWQETASQQIQQRLAEIENERPETLAGWQKLFSAAGLDNLVVRDKSHLQRIWTKHVRKTLGLRGQLRIVFYALRTWGLPGYHRLRESERIFASSELGYALLVGQKRAV